jgi:peptide/nickel transport system substrate-binding protein
MLRGAGAALGMTLIGGGISGCGSSSQGTTPTAAAGAAKPAAGSPTPLTPKAGGTVTLVSANQLGNINPHLSTAAGLDVATFTYDRVLNYDNVHGTYEAITAQSIENPDPLTFVIKVNPKAKFQNVPPVPNRAVTSEDIAYSWKALVDNPRATTKAFFVDFVDRYETPDAATLIVKMKKPNAWTLTASGFGNYPAVVMPKEFIDANLMEKTAIGSGAYLLDQFDANTISFKKRPDGWHMPGRPYIDKVVYLVITDAAARAAALKGKQIDQTTARDKLEAEEFKSYGPDMVIDKELYFPGMLMMRADADGLFKDVRVREAIYNAIDIQGLIDQVELGDGELTGPVPTLFSAYSLPPDELKTVFRHDVKKAKDLLAAAGWDSSQEVEFKYPTSGGATKGDLYVQALQQQLAAVGIKTKLVPSERATVWQPQVAQQRDFQLTATNVFLISASLDTWLRMWGKTGIGTGNLARWSDPEVDDLIDRQMTEFDTEKQKKLILDLQRLILKKFAPIVNLYSPYTYTGRWGHFHPVLGQGHVGSAGHYAWTEKP